MSSPESLSKPNAFGVCIWALNLGCKNLHRFRYVLLQKGWFGSFGSRVSCCGLWDVYFPRIPRGYSQGCCKTCPALSFLLILKRESAPGCKLACCKSACVNFVCVCLSGATLVEARLSNQACQVIWPGQSGDQVDGCLGAHGAFPRPPAGLEAPKALALTRRCPWRQCKASGFKHQVSFLLGDPPNLRVPKEVVSPSLQNGCFLKVWAGTHHKHLKQDRVYW